MKLCVLVPAYNCELYIPELVKRTHLPGEKDEILVVDDCSDDNSLDVANSLPRVFAVRNEVNRGYGATSQRLFQLALERDADLVINIHGDLAHPPENIQILLDYIMKEDCDIVVGARLLYLVNLVRGEGWTKLLDKQARYNMPLIRVFGHFWLTGFQNFCFGTKLHSFHEGMRACKREVVEWIVTQNNFTAWYEYDTELLVRAHRQGFNIAEVPVKPNYSVEKPPSAAPPFRYGVSVLRHAMRHLFTSK
jgi:glycosyltransferase involved in cell wall biosynthesis